MRHMDLTLWIFLSACTELLCETALKKSKESRGDVSQAVGVMGKRRLSWITVVSSFGLIDPFLSKLPSHAHV